LYLPVLSRYLPATIEVIRPVITKITPQTAMSEVLKPSGAKVSLRIDPQAVNCPLLSMKQIRRILKSAFFFRRFQVSLKLRRFSGTVEIFDGGIDGRSSITTINNVKMTA